MDEFGFPVTVQSNASMTKFPKNNASSFITHLAKPLTLDEWWALGLTSIDYGLTFKKGKGKRLATDDIATTASKRVVRAASPDPSRRISDLGISEMKRGGGDIHPSVLENLTSEHQKEYDQWKHENVKLSDSLNSCEEGKSALVIKYKDDMQRLLDQHQKLLHSKDQQIQTLKSSSKYWEKNFVSLAGMAYKDANQMNDPDIPKYLYIYCNVVKMRQICDTYANFLHIAQVPPIRLNGDTGREKFDFPQYMQVGQQYIDHIEINIRDENGKLVNFSEDCVTIVSLHFKKIRH